MSSILEDADQRHAEYSAARAGLLEAVAELQASQTWQGRGSVSLAAFLAARWQISPATARELVRDARGLAERPALREALGSGAVSVDQCKAVQVLSDDDDDAQSWLEALSCWSYPELEREARKKTARKLERRDDGVYLRMRHTPDERYLRGEFQLHPEDGATVLAAVDARVPDGTRLRDWDHASARALVELATDSLSGVSGSAPRATMLVSVTEDTLTGQAQEAAGVGTQGFVGAETARRLGCDARLQAVFKDVEGKMTGIGRTSRVIPGWLRRVVEDRDGGVCVFPGCDRSRYLECHHVVHWADGGTTEFSNLVLVCWTHHELLHEYGWSLEGEAGPHITWIRPDGSPHEPRVRVGLDTC